VEASYKLSEINHEPIGVPVDFVDFFGQRSLTSADVQLLKEPAGMAHSLLDVVLGADRFVLRPRGSVRNTSSIWGRVRSPWFQCLMA
jgi:hypothetical protein